MTQTVRAVKLGVGKRALGWTAAAFMSLGIVGAAGSASAASYIDAALGEVKPADKVVIANPQPVQLLFEFQTKGALNARGTQMLKAKVLDAVKSTGMFSDISDAPVANGAVLEIVLNDAPAPGDMAAAEGKGFVTGATFFVAGSTVRENYICTVNYIAGPTSPKITRTVNDGVYFQIGLINSPPANAVKIGGMNDAIFAMARLVVVNPLNALGSDPAFLPGGSAPTASAAAPADATPPTTATAASAPAAPPATTPVTAPTPAPVPQATPAPAATQ
jgi:hypothetical protein